MVGIILASHGEFANGIFQSGAMIFGEQANVKPCTLMPSEGPEDIRKKMEDAIASFENQEEVLFLVDLWGGTPFNQASALLDGHEDKWAIVDFQWRRRTKLQHTSCRRHKRVYRLIQKN